MNGNDAKGMAGKIRVILPVILRITFCLAMWTLGVLPIIVPLAEAQTRVHRVVQTIPVDRARVENLQRWVNSGHDAWCRNANAVATMAVRRISPEFANYDFEIASLTTQGGKPSTTKAVYVFHSLDGHTSYRVTVCRFGWQTKSAGTPDRRIWVPVRSETITRYSLD